MIPKVIHYCWFGRNPLPPLAVKCIESWKKYLPDYEIKEWNEDNFDVNIIPYTQEAYQAKKYAFVSDYARFWILYKYGGIYFDTDVEVIKPLDDIIARGPFMGCEKDGATGGGTPAVAPGLGLGVNPGLGLYKEILEMYAMLHFIRRDGSYNLKTVVSYTTEILCRYGLKDTNEIQKIVDIWIYPKEYFCPINYQTGAYTETLNTRTIHHYNASWVSEEDKCAKRIKNNLNFLPNKLRGHIAAFYALCVYRGVKDAIQISYKKWKVKLGKL